MARITEHQKGQLKEALIELKALSSLVDNCVEDGDKI